MVKTAFENLKWLSRNEALKLAEIYKKKVLHCAIRDFQNAVTFFVWRDRNEILPHFRKLLILGISISTFKRFDKKKTKTSLWSETWFSENFPENDVIMRHKWHHISKYLSSIERGYQYNLFDIPIKYLRQFVTALGQILLIFFYLYTGHMTSSEHYGKPSDVITLRILYLFIYFIYFFLHWPKILT